MRLSQSPLVLPPELVLGPLKTFTTSSVADCARDCYHFAWRILWSVPDTETESVSRWQNPCSTQIWPPKENCSAPSLTYQAFPETIQAAGPRGPSKKPGPAKGITEEHRWSWSFGPFISPSLKPSGSQEPTSPSNKSKAEKKSSRETQSTWGRQIQLNPWCQLEHEWKSAILTSGWRTFSPFTLKGKKAI